MKGLSPGAWSPADFSRTDGTAPLTVRLADLLHRRPELRTVRVAEALDGSVRS